MIEKREIGEVHKRELGLQALFSRWQQLSWEQCEALMQAAPEVWEVYELSLEASVQGETSAASRPSQSVRASLFAQVQTLSQEKDTLRPAVLEEEPAPFRPSQSPAEHTQSAYTRGLSFPLFSAGWGLAGLFCVLWVCGLWQRPLVHELPQMRTHKSTYVPDRREPLSVRVLRPLRQALPDQQREPQHREQPQQQTPLLVTTKPAAQRKGDKRSPPSLRHIFDTGPSMAFAEDWR